MAQVVGGVPDPDAEAGEEGRAEAGGLDDLRSLDRYADRVGLQLAQQVVGAAPPSTRSEDSCGITSSTSRTSNAIASSVARTMCARVVPRVSPTIRPRACGSQCGAPSPVRAGTKTTPPLSETVDATAWLSAAEPTIWMPSRSHCTAAPVTKIEPSDA